MHRFTQTESRTLAIEDRDYPEWHRGRKRYAVWVIDADVAPIRERVQRARSHLRNRFSPHQRPPHITLFVCGFWRDQARLEDDFDPLMLAVQLRALSAASVAPFTLTIGNLDSFDSAAFLGISGADEKLESLREALVQGREEIRQAPFTPHLTVGLYRDRFDKREVAQQLAAFPESAPIELQVDRIHFASYAARELGGAFEIVETFALGGRGQRG
jgi:2'-5' RNA ligase